MKKHLNTLFVNLATSLISPGARPSNPQTAVWKLRSADLQSASSIS
jgi:hypothetical protein